MKHILIASDLSDESLRPFDFVMSMAEKSGAKVTLLHVVHELVVAAHGSPLAPPITSPDLSTEIAEAKEALAKQSAALGDGVPVETVVTSSPQVPEAISQYAAENEVDLIAISTHGRSGWRHLVLGSVAEAVIRRSKVPVLSFPRNE